MSTINAHTAEALRDLYDIDGVATVYLYEVADLAQELATDATQTPTPDEVNTRVTGILTRATTIARYAERTIGDYTDRVPAGLYKAFLDCGNRIRAAASTIRDTAPDDATLHAAHHAAHTIIDRIGCDVLRVAYTQAAAV